MLKMEELKELTETGTGPCVSIYMPTHKAGKATRQDPIRYKNLLREAERRLVAGGLRSADARDMLAEGNTMVRDSLFWGNQSDGLAVFFSAETHRRHVLPLPFEELVVVGDRFHVKPLLALFTGDGRFYILALSRNDIRLLQGTRFGVREVDLPEVPGSLAEALRYDDPEKSIQFRTIEPRGGGKRPAVYHGHGAGVDDAKENLRRFFRQVDAGLLDVLGQEQAPLVLAGVDYLFPIYREASTYPGLLEEGIPGNPDTASPEELHRHAWRLVHPRFLVAQEEAGNRYRELIGTGRASGNPRVVVPAAYHGRVETLFVAVGEQRWGAFDPERGNVHMHRKRRPLDTDLLDFAAVHTFLNSGTVYAVQPGKVPGGSSIASVFRY
ncbi:MAG: hypothetical protein WBX50_07935 [Candidatus Deferrimicrobiaceae bacterium]